MNKELAHEFTAGKFNKALKQMHSTKALGHHGMPPFLFFLSKALAYNGPTCHKGSDTSS